MKAKVKQQKGLKKPYIRFRKFKQYLLHQT